MHTFARNLMGWTALVALSMGCGDGGDDNGLKRKGAKVEPTAAYRECSQDSDCVLVGTDCNGCCGQDAIASALEDQYQKGFESACEGYSGPVCDCDFLPLVAQCRAGACAAVTPDPAAECGGSAEYAVERKDGKVEPPPAYRECSQDSDCMLVTSDCNGCCGQDAIASGLADKFEKARECACGDYHKQEGICDCSFLPLAAQCRAGVCSAVRTDDPEQQCAAVNEKIETELARLRTCDAASDCGKLLPTLGSCGCTNNLVGRQDANTKDLAALYAQRTALSDVPACGELGGDCSCPPRGGVDCVENVCRWVDIVSSDPCAGLDGAYASVEELECGLTPDGPAACHWSLTFDMGTFQWQHSDVGETGSYKCIDGAITASAGAASTYLGTITADRTLTFDGVAYRLAP